MTDFEKAQEIIKNTDFFASTSVRRKQIARERLKSLPADSFFVYGPSKVIYDPLADNDYEWNLEGLGVNV
jgi:hypothetical protein